MSFSQEFMTPFVSNGCVSSHLFFINHEDEIFGCGYNKNGQLGLGYYSEEELTPKKVSCPTDWKIKQMACGAYHSVFLLKDGRVYGCGSNSRGQLGREPYPAKKNGDSDGTGSKDVSGMVNQACSPELVTFFKDTAMQIACGEEYTACVMNDGKLFMFGSNGNGQLGIGHKNDQYTPQPVVFRDESLKVRQVSCGRCHSAALMEDGSVHVFGYNVFEKDMDAPTPIPMTFEDNDMIDQVSCGGYHTVCVSTGGLLYTFGSNNSGQLCLGHLNDVRTPTRIDYFKNAKIDIKKASSGLNHTICETKDDEFYGFGGNESYQLHLGNTRKRLEPEKLKPIENEKIRSAICFGSNSCFISESKRLFGVGGNKYGELGIGNNSAAQVPKVISTGVRVYGSKREEMDELLLRIAVWKKERMQIENQLRRKLDNATASAGGIAARRSSEAGARAAKPHGKAKAAKVVDTEISSSNSVKHYEDELNKVRSNVKRMNDADPQSDDSDTNELSTFDLDVPDLPDEIAEIRRGNVREKQRRIQEQRRNVRLEDRIRELILQVESLESLITLKDGEMELQSKETESQANESMNLVIQEQLEHKFHMRQLRRDKQLLTDKIKILEEKYNRTKQENLFQVGELEKLRSKVEDISKKIGEKRKDAGGEAKSAAPVSAKTRKFKIMQLELAKILLAKGYYFSELVSSLAPSQQRFVPAKGEELNRSKHVFAFFQWLSEEDTAIEFAPDDVSVLKENLKKIGCKEGCEVVARYEEEREHV